MEFLIAFEEILFFQAMIAFFFSFHEPHDLHRVSFVIESVRR